MKIQDSGERRQFESGAVRDIAEGKGRCDLLPLDIIGEITNDPILINIAGYVQTGSRRMLIRAFNDFATSNASVPFGYSSLQTAIIEVSKHYEEGCNKYGERNWEKGIPLHCYIDSAVRHYLKYLRGDEDEPHDRAFLWNILGALWTQKHHPEYCDLPFNKEEDE